MQLVIKLKSGATYATDIGTDFSNVGDGNLLQLLQRGKDFDGDVNIGQQHFKWHDVYSLEFVI